MDLEQQLHAALARCEPGPAPLAAVMAQVSAGERSATRSSRRKVGRPTLFGIVLAVAAAAALLAMRLMDTPALQRAVVAPGSAPASGPTEAVAADLPPPGPVRSASQPVEEKSPEKEAAAAVKPFTVQVLPLQNQTKDAPSSAAVESFYAALLAGLRSVPGLTLIDPDPTGLAPAAPAGYRIAITGTGPRPGNKFGVGLRIEKTGPDGTSRGQFTSAAPGEIAPACAGIVSTDFSSCADPAGVAAQQLGLLRTMVFPPDPSLLKQLRGRLLDRSLDPRERLKALADLGSVGAVGTPEDRDPGAGTNALHDPVVIRGVIDLVAAADPMQRAQIWREMRGVRSADLVSPLTDSSRRDPDGEVRLQAIATLAADFGDDPRARTTFETVAREDSRPLLRAVAQRALTGDAGWKEYIVGALKDVSRSDVERIEALFYYMNLPITNVSGSYAPAPYWRLQGMLDDEAVQALIEVLPRAAASSPTVKQSVVSLVGDLTVINQPAITAMLLDGLEHGSGWLDRMSTVKQLDRSVRDPRVRAAFEKISADDPDPELRQIAAQALNSPGVPTAQ